ncbi:Hpt domain-containing protein [Mangrovicella endophytica]|uniref:Hpt domain-containing protein n=1 Tax=Mangrovicella endophytica TaxID=2066697 RepID=UPI000C9EB1F2|nr:Hpt domain-containing protein [Mangrovicella endophytica]
MAVAAVESDYPDAAAEAGPSRARPVDLVHLARQSYGDRTLERDVLAILSRQIAAAAPRLALVNPDERRQIAHKLRGAALSVGAFPLADAADDVESMPDDAAALLALIGEIDRTRRFIENL